jgi:hypothetical protein
MLRCAVVKPDCSQTCEKSWELQATNDINDRTLEIGHDANLQNRFVYFVIMQDYYNQEFTFDTKGNDIDNDKMTSDELMKWMLMGRTE